MTFIGSLNQFVAIANLSHFLFLEKKKKTILRPTEADATDE